MEEKKVEYISKAEALKIVGFEEKWLSDTKSTNYDVDIAFHGLKKKIESAPSADVRENIHGEWINETPHADGCPIYTCSECGRSNLWESPFCPSCGADMREPKEEKGTE